MSIPPLATYALGRLVANLAINGELESLNGMWRRAADRLLGAEPDARPELLNDCLTMLEDRDQILAAIRGITEDSPPPGHESIRAAHAGDLNAANESGRFLWQNWLVRGHLNLLSSDPKVGKTHIILDLARRLYFGLPWPDGQAPTLPAGTKVLWIAGDRHQDEIKERAQAFGLPDDATLFNAMPSNPYGGCCLDEEGSIDTLRKLVEVERPGLVAIDTVWRATHRQLRREEELNALFDPIIAIAQQADTTILGAMHLSKDGDTLGRRIEGMTRAILKLYRPDPENQPDRRRLTVLGNFREPPPLGITMGTTSCEYDVSPPTAPAGGKTGRPADKLNKAVAFITERLTEQNDLLWDDLRKGWMDTGETHDKTFRTAVDRMIEEKTLDFTGGRGTKQRMILHLNGLGAEDDTLY